jgi:VanZ family protein
MNSQAQSWPATNRDGMSKFAEKDDLHPFWRMASGFALAGYWLALFVATHIPRPPEVLSISNGDKVLHLGAYAGLALLAAWYSKLRWPTARRRYLVIFLLLIAYGVLDELLQIPVERSAEVADWMADVAGVSLGLGIYFVVSSVWTSIRRARQCEEAPALATTDKR